MPQDRLEYRKPNGKYKSDNIRFRDDEDSRDRDERMRPIVLPGESLYMAGFIGAIVLMTLFPTLILGLGLGALITLNLCRR